MPGVPAGVLPDRVNVPSRSELTIRARQRQDAPALHAAIAASAAHLRPWMAWADDALSLEERVGWIDDREAERLRGGDALYGIFAGPQVAGGCGLHRRRGPDVLEIGYWLHIAFTRRGIATEAAQALARVALVQPGIRAVEIHHDRANVASAAVPRRLDFRFAGEQPDEKAAPAEVGVDCTWRLSR